MSANTYVENQYYSAKKEQHSIVILIITSPTGKYLYIGSCKFGSLIDFDLFMVTVNDWIHFIDLLIEWGFTDHGFLGLNIFNIMPPPTKNHTTPQYKAHSKRRIRIENYIAKLKDFTILRHSVRESIVGGLLNAKMYQWEQILNSD